MMTSSTFPIRKAIFVMCLAFMVFPWIAWVLLGQYFAEWFGAHWNEQLLALTNGKTDDVVGFVYYRLREFSWLASLAGLLILLATVFYKGFRKRFSSWPGAWLIPALSIFFGLNFFTAVAARTAVFWLLLWQGDQTHNYVRFNLKQVLAQEIVAPSTAVIVGNSQVRAMIDEFILNKELGKSLWTTELHFPGTQAFDLLLIKSKLHDLQPDLIICSISELTFYAGMGSDLFPLFMDSAGRQAYHDLTKGASLDHRQQLRYARLGTALPLFRLRTPIAERVLGIDLFRGEQRAHDLSLDKDLTTRAETLIQRFSKGPTVAVQQQAFELFLEEWEARGVPILVIVAPLNPILLDRLPLDIRQSMAKYLNELEERCTAVEIWREADLPVIREQDFTDLTHVNKSTQERVTKQLLEDLRYRFTANQYPRKQISED